jgi:para-nitrobenzyl esterase
MEGPIAVTTCGRIRGERSGSVNVWKGVPYAAPPVGRLRFRAPETPESWSGVRDATAFGPVSHQPSDPRGSRYGGVQPLHSEDCLYLNVWSPAEGGEGLPVMFWIHGGTFLTGSGRQPLFDGSSFATRGGVVVVTINYRLGPFGFLHLSPLGGGLASNQGLLDQIAALEWVRANIAAFGGDPNRVTVFGESAGSMSIAALLAMPAAKGLFAGAIMQSGAAQALPSQKGSDIAAALLAELGIAPGGDPGVLQSLPAEDILAAAGRISLTLPGGALSMPFQPVIDPGTLPEHPAVAVSAGSAAGIPLLIGTNKDEGSLYFREDVPSPDFTESLTALEILMGITDLDKQVSDYRPTWEGQAEILTDFFFWSNSIAFAERQGSHGPVWMYRFDYTVPGHPLLGKAVHGAEIAYVFNNLSHLKWLGVEPGPAMLACSGVHAERLDCLCP